MLISAVQSPISVGGVGGVVGSGEGAALLSLVSPGEDAKVTVDANAGVAESSVPIGVGEDNGVTNIFGVGVGGLSKCSGKSGAIERFT